MELISLYLPYTYKRDHPKFEGLNTLVDMYKREGENLSKYLKSETDRLNKEIEEGKLAVKSMVNWIFTLSTVVCFPEQPNTYSIIATPYLNNEQVTDSELLSSLGIRDSYYKHKNSVKFHFVNNVMICSNIGHSFTQIINGSLVTDEEILSFEEGIIPERFKTL